MPTTSPATWLALSGPGTRPEDVVSTIRAALAELPASSITVFDRDLRHLLVRGTILATGGVDPEQLEGGLAPDVLDPDVWAFYRPLYETALSGEQTTADVSSVDGLRHYKIRVGPVRSRSGATVGGVVIATDITEERAAHLALAVSEERFRLLAENSSDMVMRTTPDGVIEWVSPSISKVVGWVPEELVGTRSIDLAHPDYVAGVRSATSAVNTGATVSGRLQVRCKDGSYRWMSRTMRPLFDDGGEVVSRVSGWHDVQREVEAEQALAASESLFRLAMDASAIGMYFGTLEGRITHVNQALCQLLGYSAAELLTMSFLDLTHPDDVEASRAGIDELAVGDREVARVRKRYVARDGATVWADLTAAVAPLPDGTMGRIICQVVDVTVEVANFEALQRSARDFQMLAENATDVVFRTGVDGLFEWVSPSMATVLGWEPSTLIGTPATALIVAEDRDLVRDNRLAMQAGEQRGPLVVRFMTAAGAVREMSGNTHLVLAPDGAALVGYIVGLRDVTEEQRIRRELAHRASHDSLTGVSNRDDLMSRLRRRLEVPPKRNAWVGVLFCDVDNLKSVNDAHGHPAGDVVLATVAARLLAAVRSHDVVARLGGDEFVVVVNDVEDLERLSQVAEKCRLAVSAPISSDGRRIEISVSVGGVLATPSEDADEVLKRADLAVYRAKEAGRDQVVVEGHR